MSFGVIRRRQCGTALLQNDNGERQPRPYVLKNVLPEANQVTDVVSAKQVLPEIAITEMLSKGIRDDERNDPIVRHIVIRSGEEPRIIITRVTLLDTSFAH